MQLQVPRGVMIPERIVREDPEARSGAEQSPPNRFYNGSGTRGDPGVRTTTLGLGTPSIVKRHLKVRPAVVVTFVTVGCVVAVGCVGAVASSSLLLPSAASPLSLSLPLLAFPPSLFGPFVATSSRVD